METIKFYFQGTELGLASLSKNSFAGTRRRIAKRIGINQYDRFVILDENHNVRADTDDVNPKDLFNDEFRPIQDFNDVLHQTSCLDFGQALDALKSGSKVSRKGWGPEAGWPNPHVSLELQNPDEHSKMTLPYLYMNKGKDKFPCDLSCESIMAIDWYIVE
jgi:hypothetical protein